jgi:hypothetical protein
MKRILILCALLLCLPVVASAAIAVFADGRTMKIDAYRVDSSMVHLGLSGGATMSLPLGRLDRIVDDEVITPEVAAEVRKIAAEGVFPRRSWRYSAERKPMFDSRFDATIVKAARHFDVDAALVSAVIKAESDYNPRTVSHKGARGLMQLMPATAVRFGVTNSFDPEQNIYAGTRYLRWLLEKFEGNADLAVAAYNAGEGNVWKYNGVPPFRETVTYINRIARHLHRLEVVADGGVPAAATSQTAVADSGSSGAEATALRN